MVDPKKLKLKVISYEKFRDITKSIQIVALSNISELKENIANRFLALTPFLSFFNIKHYAECENMQCLVMPITIDKNCCGPHNNEIFGATEEIIDTLEETFNTVRTFSTGVRCRVTMLRDYPGSLIKHIARYNKDIAAFSIFSFSIIVEKIIKLNLDRYFIVFNRFISVFAQETSCYQVCSFNEFTNILVDKMDLNESIFHRVALDNKDFPNYLSDLYNFGLSLVLMDAFEENEYSSLGARIVAMDSAKKNAGKLIEELTIKYHRARQESITNELIEIVSCANFV
jgi:F-type H+-transporting ATPase subunit gamma